MRRILVISLISCIPLCAQEYKISGSVIQGEAMEMPFANLLLYYGADTSFVKGAVSDKNGFFAIGNIVPGRYLLQASYMGNSSEYLTLELNSDLDVGPLLVDVKVEELKEVVVVFKKPTVEQQVDRLVFNIENTALSESNIWEVLKSTPSLFVMNNEITVKGEKGIQILINDKKVNLPAEDILNLLNGTSASSVQAIEVITAPPSKYDAEGNAIINIRMKKNLISGYNGAVYNTYSQGVFPEHTLGTNHFFKGEKLETSFNYSFGARKNITYYTDIIHFMENGRISESWSSDLSDLREGKRHNASMFLDYGPDGNNTFSFSAILAIRPNNRGVDDSKTNISTANDPNTTGFFTNNESELESINAGFYLDYERKLNDKGASLNLDSHFAYYNYDRDQVLETDFYDGDGAVVDEHDFSTRNRQQTRLFSLQADFSTPLSEKSNFESGIKYALTRSESIIAQEGFDRNRPGIDPTENGVFLYDENIVAAYASFDSKWKNWTFKSGLRAEYTKTIGDFSLDDESVENDYLELFPTFYLQFDPNAKHHFGLNFRRSIIRPDYSDINPFQAFQSNNSVVEGNVNLRPSYKNSLIFNYTFNTDYTFELFYRYHQNRITLFTFQDNTSKLLRFITDNSNRELAYGLDFIYSKEITKFWDTYLLSSYFYAAERFKVPESIEMIDSGRWTFFLQFQNNFTLLSDRSLTASINFSYVSPIIVANSKQEEYKFWDLSLKKNIWGKKASLSLGVSDIFNQFQLHNSRKYGNQNNISFYRPDSRMLTLGFRYNFGNMGIKDNYKSKGTDEDDRL